MPVSTASKRLAIVVAAIVFNAAVGLAQAAEPTILEKRLVWSHSMMCFPLDLKYIIPYHPDTGAESYGANYPLEQELGLEARSGHGWLETDIEDAKNAGIDGFFVDVFTGNCKGYFEAADRVGGFLIAPCIDLSGVPKDKIEDVAVRTIVANCKAAESFKSPARVGDALVVFDYGSEMMAPDAWSRVIQHVNQAGYKIYFVGAVNGDGDLAGKSLLPPTIAQWLPAFDAGYSFGGMGKWFHDVTDLYRAAGKPFMGGMMPGYYRIGGGHTDARGTALYRSEWHRMLDAGLPWICESTWNDLSENTHILPAADLNDTRSDITRWFSAKFKGRQPPWSGPQLYITTPKTVYPNAAYVAEALVLNGASRPATVRIELIDSAGKPLRGAEPASADVAPGQDGAAMVTFSLTQRPGSGYVRARASVLVGGKPIARVASAPTVWLDPIAQPGYATMYYSIPAQLALPGKVDLSLSPGPDGAQIATVTPPKADIKFVDLLHNGELVRNFFATPPYRQSVPRRDSGNAIVGKTTWGYYVSRVIDKDHRVAYSDPVYVAPKGDLRVTETYSFDEGAGASAADSSAYERTARLVKATWSTPGSNGLGACVSFNGVDSRVDLPLAQGPNGPMQFAVSARPRAYAGNIYCDSGGMWLSIGGGGTAQFVRRGPSGWVTVTGKSRVPLDEWTRFRCVWDGAKMSLYVNDKLDGEAECPPAFGSFRRALGCNPYGSGSGYWNGDIDDFKIEMLK